MELKDINLEGYEISEQAEELIVLRKKQIPEMGGLERTERGVY